jgi:hypothetical protein
MQLPPLAVAANSALFIDLTGNYSTAISRSDIY